MRNKKGFTLIEIILVVTIMALLSIAALSSSVTIQKYYLFKNDFTQVLTEVQQARLYAITQKIVPLDVTTNTCTFDTSNQGLPFAYGINIQNDSENTYHNINFFADLESSNTSNLYSETCAVGTSKKDYLISNYSLATNKYDIYIYQNSCTTNLLLQFTPVSGFHPIGTPAPAAYLNLLYTPTTAQMLVIQGDSLGQSSIDDANYICIVIKDRTSDYFKNIIVFPKSGIAEDIDPTDYSANGL